MNTIYLLEKCTHCNKLLDHLNQYPNKQYCFIMVSKSDAAQLKFGDNRFNKFPIMFSGVPTKMGLPYKNSKVLQNSKMILSKMGKNINTDFKNIHKSKPCFGKTCYVMNRPFGPEDNKMLLNQKLQSNYFNSFGSTPGTPEFLYKPKYEKPNTVLNNNKMSNYKCSNTFNVPMQYSSNNLNTASYNKFGNPCYLKDKPTSLLGTSGSNTISRQTGDYFYKYNKSDTLQVPKSSYLHANINNTQSQLLKNGLNHFGNDNNENCNYINTNSKYTPSQFWKPNMFPNNGNKYGKKCNKSKKDKKKEFTSALGIKFKIY